MNEEEKRAIEHLTKKMEYHKNKPLDTFVWLTLDEHYVRIVLNLIEKQQKELNNLKEIEKSHQEENGKLRVELEQEKEGGV